MTIKSKFVCSVLSLMVTFTACKSKTANELIVNNWKMTELGGKASGEIPDSVKVRMYREASVEFKKDGSCTFYNMGPAESKGTFSLSADGKTLVSKDESGQPDTVKILELTADKLVVEDNKSEIKLSFKSK